LKTNYEQNPLNYQGIFQFDEYQTLARGRAIPAFGTSTRLCLAGEERFAVLIFLDYKRANKVDINMGHRPAPRLPGC